MPHQITFDREKGVALLRMWGELTPGEVRETVTEALAEPLVANAPLSLVDLREVTSVAALRVEDIRSVAAGRLPESSRLAIVAPDSAAFGLARMFTALRNLKESQAKIGVFRTLIEAEGWLGAGAL